MWRKYGNAGSALRQARRARIFDAVTRAGRKTRPQAIIQRDTDTFRGKESPNYYVSKSIGAEQTNILIRLTGARCEGKKDKEIKLSDPLPALHPTRRMPTGPFMGGLSAGKTTYCNPPRPRFLRPPGNGYDTRVLVIMEFQNPGVFCRKRKSPPIQSVF